GGVRPLAQPVPAGDRSVLCLAASRTPSAVPKIVRDGPVQGRPVGTGLPAGHDPDEAHRIRPCLGHDPAGGTGGAKPGGNTLAARPSYLARAIGPHSMDREENTMVRARSPWLVALTLSTVLTVAGVA